MYMIYNDDCLNKLKEIEDKSINLILIDPPYNIGKDKKWDKWKTVNAYVEFMGKVFKECERVLKDNGSFYFFHNDFLQIVELQNYINKNTNFRFNSFIIWDKGDFRALSWKNPSEKNNLRSWFNTCEYCLYYTFQDETGLSKVLTRNNFSRVSEKIRKYVEDNFSRDYIIKLFVNEGRYSTIESARVHASYKMGWNKGKRFDLMDEKLFNYLNSYLHFPFKYEELRQEYEELRQEYEDLRYTHNLDKNHKNVWTSNEKNNGKLHSCQKPLDILERIIKTSSNEGDVVLDCFMGSGSTGVACLNTNRRFIGIEKEEKYFNIAKNRMEEAKGDLLNE